MRRTLESRGDEDLDAGAGAGFEQEVRNKRQRAMGLPAEGRIQLAALNEIPQGHLFRARIGFFHIPKGIERETVRHDARRTPRAQVGCVPLLNAPSPFPGAGDGASKSTTHPTAMTVVK